MLVRSFAGLVAAMVLTAVPLNSAALAQNPPAASTPDQALDTILQKTAATRLLATMGPQVSADAKVARLIDQLTSDDGGHVQTAVTALVMLGRSAIPSIVKRVDDRRAMRMHSIAFENSPQAFEAVAQYGCAQVVDCLNLVLVVLTGERCGFIDISIDFDFNDQRAADLARKEIVNCWRRYLAREKPTLRVPTKSLPMAESPSRASGASF